MEHFLWPPNWKTPVVERLEYLTDVQQSSNGTEVRIPLRTAPRSSLTFEIFAHGADAVRLKNFIQQNQGKEVMIPWWVHGAEWGRSSAITSERFDTRYGTSSTSLGFQSGNDRILFIVDGVQYVRNVRDGDITHRVRIESGQAPVPAADMLRAKIYPMVKCLMNASTSLTTPTGSILHGSIAFEATENIPHRSDTLDEQFEGLPVFTLQPNRAQDQTLEYGRLISELDFMTGKRSFYDHSGQSFRTVSHEYVLQEFKGIIPFKGFLNSLRGRKGMLHLPSFECDFPNFGMNTASTLSATLSYDDVGYRFTDHPPQLLWIRSNKDTYLREVVSFGSRVGVESIRCGPIPRDTSEVFSDVQILYKSRLVSDTVEIVWHSSTVASANLSFRTLRV